MQCQWQRAVRPRALPVGLGPPRPKGVLLRPGRGVLATQATAVEGHLTYSDIQRDWGQGQAPPKPLPPPPKSPSLRAVLPYFLSLGLSDYRLLPRVAVAMCLIFTSKLAGLACPFFVKQAVDTLTSGVTTPPPIVFPLPIPVTPAVQAALFAVACFGLCDIIKHVCKEAQAPIFLPVTQSVARRVTYHTFDHVLNLDVSYHLEKRTGKLSRILERGPRAIQQIYRAVIFIFLPTTLELVAVTTVLVRTFSPLVGGLVGATFLAYTIWSVALTQMATEVRKQVIDLDNLTTSKAVDALLNFETVTLFNNQKLEVGQFFNCIKAYQGATSKTERLSAVLNAGQAIILALGMSSVMFAAVLVGRGGSSATAGDLVMIQGLLLQLWAPLQFLGWLYRELKNSLVEIDELVDILKTTSRIPDGHVTLPAFAPSVQILRDRLASAASTHSRNGSSSSGSSSSSSSGAAAGLAASRWPDMVGERHHAAAGASHHESSAQPFSEHGLKLPSTNGSADASSSSAGSNGNGSAIRPSYLPARAFEATDPTSTGLEIELKDVHFGYSSDRKILNGVSLHVGPGQSVAIVGPSGSGKSTILKLLTRQYDITQGSVLLNGCEMRDLTLDSLRAAVAVVPQDTVLFNDSILQNIRYGRPEARDEEVMEAARMARLDEAVKKMPQGFQTVVGERGLKLSGGEKQRVAIARAFLRSPRLLICDEATSALDTATEAQIIESLESLSVGRTSIFVAHRLSTVKSCDKIIVLQDGRVVEEGSHTELMEREAGVYRTMWQQQSAENGPEDWMGRTVDGTVDDNGSEDEEQLVSGVRAGRRVMLE